MTERPIIYSGPMIPKILDGSKTQTRRVIRPQPSDNGTGRWSWICDSTCRKNVGTWRFGVVDSYGETFTDRGREDSVMYRCPYGQPGDVLWVREKWRVAACYDDMSPSQMRLSQRQVEYAGVRFLSDTQAGRWRPSIHMPKWAARTWLRVTGVRGERVQDITEVEAVDEGCDAYSGVCSSPMERVEFDGLWARDEFAALWDSINAKRGYGWHVNPWVWVIKFERCGEPAALGVAT